MNISVRNIGNSKGIILPKSIMNLCGIKDAVNLEVKYKNIILTNFKAIDKPKNRKPAKVC